jgi:hypothetical protein
MLLKRGATLVMTSAIAFFCAVAPSGQPIQLKPEVDTTLHLGQMAELRVETNQHFTINEAGRALVRIHHTQRKGQTIYVYRAAELGRQTFVLTPRNPGPDGCVSCVTVHYFVNVIQ